MRILCKNMHMCVCICARKYQSAPTVAGRPVGLAELLGASHQDRRRNTLPSRSVAFRGRHRRMSPPPPPLADRGPSPTAMRRRRAEGRCVRWDGLTAQPGLVGRLLPSQLGLLSSVTPLSHPPAVPFIYVANAHPRPPKMRRIYPA